jgi:polar amino acid transport system ATP-binding protein
LEAFVSKVILEVENLRKLYGENEVIKDISFKMNEGETVVVIGPSGTGKSTLLRCINLLTKVDGGRILLDGEDISHPKVSEDKIRQHIGMVFQDFLLFNHLDALNNVMIGQVKVLGVSKEKARARALVELDRVGLSDKVGHYPGQLSGGQKQRVAIARALAMDPRIMLFDEPTSALDPELIGEVLEVMRKLAYQGMTMLVVTHEMGFAREVANKILFLENGIVVEEGAPSDLFYKPKNTRTREFLGKIIELYGDDKTNGNPAV